MVCRLFQATIDDLREKALKLRVDLEAFKERSSALELEGMELRRRAEQAEGRFVEADASRKDMESQCVTHEAQLARAADAAKVCTQCVPTAILVRRM